MIITDENILRAENKNVTIEEATNIIKNLDRELLLTTGIGLAAPQIGINKNVAIIRLKVGKYKQNIDLINPQIIDMKYGYVNKNEACLSIPNKKFNVWRYKEIIVKDMLRPVGFVATNLDALVILHEIDHLNGILIVDKAIINKIGRNDLCPCGSKKKYKKCCG